MTLIRQLLTRKGSDIWACSPQDSVLDALKIMAEKNVGALLVQDDGQIAGIISERDYARKVILKGKASLNTSVAEIMTTGVITITPADTVQNAMELMTKHHIRHLPVVENGVAVGVVSIGDLVKNIIANQELMINQLENYISGT